jgi:hypothetical protein
MAVAAGTASAPADKPDMLPLVDVRPAGGLAAVHPAAAPKLS